jgi:hypothetical protein
MMSDLVKAWLGSAIRHGITIVGAWLVTRGWLGASQSNGFVEELSGILLCAAMFGWSILQKFAIEVRTRGIKQAIEELRLQVIATSK